MKLEKNISDWGLLPTDLKIVGELSATGSERRVKVEVEKAEIKEVAKVPKEALTHLPTARIPAEAALPQRRPGRLKSDGDLLRMLEWDTAPRGWVPSSMKGQLTCDGCGARTEAFAECRLSCRFPKKCRLCKSCYLQRNNCAFLVEILEVPTKAADRLTQPTKADSERELGSTTVT